MGTDRETPPRGAGDDAETARDPHDPRFDEETRNRARAVVPLDAGVRPAASPSPAARQIARQRALIVILFLVVLALVGALVWVLNTRYGATPVTPITQPPPTVEPTATPTPSPSLSPSPSVSPTLETSPGASPGATPAASPSPQAATTPASSLPSNSNAQLLIPVAGVRAEQLSDTFTQSRSDGRVHNAIDIMAARGTPVFAAADGTVARLFWSERGGITLYVRGTDEHTIYYYAHLDRYAEGISENKFVRRGDVIGYVGDTGNAGAGNYHLHFAVWTVDDPKRYWSGTDINPYPLLTGKR
ncbi:MAG: M23 family metallopeptidase [Pyrinomonadaceae bacterium]